MQEIANPLNHFAGPHAVSDHPPNNFARLIEIRHFARKQAHTRMAVGDYGAEWLIDFMCYRGYQFPHGHHSRDVRQFSLGFLQLRLGSLTVFNFGSCSIPLNNISGFISERHRPA